MTLSIDLDNRVFFKRTLFGFINIHYKSTKFTIIFIFKNTQTTKSLF